MMIGQNILEDQRRNFLYFMKRNNLTAYGWSKISGVTEGTIRSYIKGRSKSLNYQTLSRLATALDVEAEDIINPNILKNSNQSKFFLEKDIFIDAMDQIDGIIEKKQLEMSSKERQNLYFSLYELKMKIPNNFKNESKQFGRKRRNV